MIAVTFCYFMRVLLVQMYSLVSVYMEARVVCVLGGHCRKVQCCVCKLFPCVVNCKHAKNSLTPTTHDTAERERAMAPLALSATMVYISECFSLETRPYSPKGI